jgi:lipid A 3-O-deacylase
MIRNRRIARRALIAATSLLAFGGVSASAREAAEAVRKTSPGVFSLFWDNDLAAGTDRRYTNGIRIAWTSAELGRPGFPVRFPGWLDSVSRALSFGRGSAGGRFVSVFLDQRMYTPEDITRTETPAGEHPYAGYAGVGLAFHSMDSLEMVLGLIGPDSLAGATQRLWHRIFGFKTPAGWAGELKDEPVLGLAYDRRKRLWAPVRKPGLSADAVVRAGGSLSNALTAGGLGAGIRAGWSLPDDFGAASISPDLAGEARRERGAGTAVFAYLAAEGQAVLRDAFLDGNLWRDGPRVEKYPLRGRLAAGVMVRRRRLALSLGYVAQTRGYETERRGHIYGTFRLSFVL